MDFPGGLYSLLGASQVFGIQLKPWDGHHKAENLPPALYSLWQHAQTSLLCYPVCGYCLYWQ